MNRSQSILLILEKEIIKTAFEAGINMFDTSENYSDGKSEEEM